MDISTSREVEMLTTAGAALSTSSVKSGRRGSARAGVTINSKARLISQACECGLGIKMGSFRGMEHGNRVWYGAHYAKFHTPSPGSVFIRIRA